MNFNTHLYELHYYSSKIINIEIPATQEVYVDISMLGGLQMFEISMYKAIFKRV